jgi:hypothetical protein
MKVKKNIFLDYLVNIFLNLWDFFYTFFDEIIFKMVLGFFFIIIILLFIFFYYSV